MSRGAAGSLLIDSNLLLLLLVGSFDIRLLARFKRTNTFSSDDFRLLRDFVRPNRIHTTPHVLTEVANLANSLPAGVRRPFLGYFEEAGSTFVENFVPFVELSASASFPLFGITDAAVCEGASGAIVLTEDARLRSYVLARGLRAIGPNDLRNLRETVNRRIS